MLPKKSSIPLGLVLVYLAITIMGCSENPERPEPPNRDLEVLNGNDTNSIYLVVKAGETTNISDTANAFYYKEIKAQETSGKIGIGKIKEFTIIYKWQTQVGGLFGEPISTLYQSGLKSFTVDGNSPVSIRFKILDDEIKPIE